MQSAWEAGPDVLGDHAGNTTVNKLGVRIASFGFCKVLQGNRSEDNGEEIMRLNKGAYKR